MDAIIYEDLLTEPANQRRASIEAEPLTVRCSHELTSSVLTIDDYRQKIAQLELRIAQDTSQYNDEVGKLHQKLSKLQSSVEKNELNSQKLEYEVTLGQQKFNKEKRKQEETEDHYKNQILELQTKSSALQNELRTADNTIAENKKVYQHKLQRCQEDIRVIEAANMELKRENELLYEEKLAAEQLVVNWKTKYEDLTGKCDVLEKQRQDHTFTIQKLIKDGEYASTLEQELMSKLKDLQDRIKSFEENIEAERAAHLETKYNTEVVQLKVRESEKLLELEKVKLKECRSSLHDADQKYRKLELAYDKEREHLTQLKTRHSKLRDEYDSQRREMTGKEKHLEGITAEVKNYGHHVNELVNELEETKEKLLVAEKAKESSRKEVEFLLNNHTVISDLAISPVKNSNWNFSNMTEKIRRVIETYQTKLSNLDEKCKEAADMLMKLEEECNVHREIAWNKDRALDEAEKLVQSAQNNLSKCEIKCAGYEERLTRFREEEEYYKKKLMEKDEQLLQFSQQTCKNTLEVDQLYQTYMKSLQVIYDVLMISTSENEKNVNNGSFTGAELKDMILNRIKENQENTKIISLKYQTSCGEYEKIKTDLHHHKTGIKRLQKLNSQVLVQTEKSLTDSQTLCEKEKQKYQDEIMILESKLKVANERMVNFVNHCNGVSLEEIPHLNERIKFYENKENKTIIYTNFIQASFWGLLYQYHVLTNEKKCLARMLSSSLLLRRGVMEIVETLQDKMSDNRKHKTIYELPKNGIFRFRKFVIVVLVVNRLQRICYGSQSIVLRHKPSYGHCGLFFLQDKQQNLSSELSKQTSLINNLSIPLDNRWQQIDIKLLGKRGHEPLCECYSEYLQHLSGLFKKSSVLSLKEDTGECSLVRMLGRGLQRALDRLKRFKYPSSDLIIELLRDHILGFAEKLHRTDELRKSDKLKYKEYRSKNVKEIERHRNETAILKVKEKALKEQVARLQGSIHGMIDEQHFEEVCADLKNALQREEDLQKLFEQQIHEITNMETRLNKHESCFDEKNQELAESMSALRTAHVNLSRAESEMNEVREKMITLKHDRTHLEKCTEDQEKKITLFIRDRELLARYMRHVTTIIYNAKKQLTQSPDALYTAMSQLVADVPLQDGSQAADGNKKAPEMQLIENTVNVFFDAQRECMMRVSMLMTEKEELEKKIRYLNDEVSAHKTHIRSLRERVSSLFQQDFSENAKNVLMTSMTHGAVFVPLQEN